MYESLEVGHRQQSTELYSLGSAHRLALRFCGFYSEESTLRRAANRLYVSASAQSSNGAFLETLKIERSFRGDFGIIALHVWMLLRRMRAEGLAGKELSQAMYNVFQNDIEQRICAEGLAVRASKLLRALERSFYGSAVAYDEAIKKSSGGLTEALLRNVYFCEGEYEQARVLEEYVRYKIGCLGVTASDALLEGRVRFSNTQ